jgi:hypothetical protein
MEETVDSDQDDEEEGQELYDEKVVKMGCNFRNIIGQNLAIKFGHTKEGENEDELIKCLLVLGADPTDLPLEDEDVINLDDNWLDDRRMTLLRLLDADACSAGMRDEIQALKGVVMMASMHVEAVIQKLRYTKLGLLEWYVNLGNGERSKKSLSLEELLVVMDVEMTYGNRLVWHKGLKDWTEVKDYPDVWNLVKDRVEEVDANVAGEPGDRILIDVEVGQKVKIRRVRFPGKMKAVVVSSFDANVGRWKVEFQDGSYDVVIATPGNWELTKDPKVDKDPDMWHDVEMNQLVAIWNQNRRGYLPANVVGAVNEVRGIWLVQYGDGTLCEEMANKRSWKKPRECLLKGKCICELSPDKEEVVMCVTKNCSMFTHKLCLLAEDEEDELN